MGYLLCICCLDEALSARGDPVATRLSSFLVSSSPKQASPAFGSVLLDTPMSWLGTRPCSRQYTGSGSFLMFRAGGDRVTSFPASSSTAAGRHSASPPSSRSPSTSSPGIRTRR